MRVTIDTSDAELKRGPVRIESATAWRHATRYAKALLASARMKGLRIELTDVEYRNDGYVSARWLVILSAGRPMYIDSDGYVEMRLSHIDGAGGYADRHVRLQLGAGTLPEVLQYMEAV